MKNIVNPNHNGLPLLLMIIAALPVLGEAFTKSNIFSTGPISNSAQRQFRKQPYASRLNVILPNLGESTIETIYSSQFLMTATITAITSLAAETSTDPADMEELLKTVAIVLTLGGGLIPATISANRQMIQALSGRKGYNNGEPVKEDDPNNTFDPTAGKGVNPALRQYVIDSGASGPPLPNQKLLFSADNIPLADIIAVLGRIPDTDSIVDWRKLPSATRSGTISNTDNPPMWLPRSAFKVLIRQAKFVAWPNDPKTGQPVGGNDLKQAELSRVSKPNVQIGDAALDAVFDSWAWGASIATPDKVENTLKLFKQTPTELDLDAFVGAAIRGREYTTLIVEYIILTFLLRFPTVIV
jgi:hypothetical protein